MNFTIYMSNSSVFQPQSDGLSKIMSHKSKFGSSWKKKKLERKKWDKEQISVTQWNINHSSFHFTHACFCLNVDIFCCKTNQQLIRRRSRIYLQLFFVTVNICCGNYHRTQADKILKQMLTNSCQFPNN